MKTFYSITLSEVTKVTDDCTVLTFNIPEELKEKFAFKQGQHLTLKTTVNNQEVRRSYSLCSSPVEDKWQVAVKKIPAGLFSNYANNILKVGDVLDIMPPNGTFFTPVEEDKSKNYIAFAAGSGITPILSIIKTHLQLEPNSTFRLFYVNKTVTSIIFRDEIEDIKNRYIDRFEIFHFLTKEERDIPLLNGRITPQKLEIITSKIIDISAIDHCFICGPEEMVFLIKDSMVSLGLSAKKIHFELFVSGTSIASQKHITTLLKSKSKHTKITVIDAGKRSHFEMNPDCDNILDAALINNADLPFACKGGVCCTCKAKLVEGTVTMKVNYALEKEEVEKGFILTCQSVPTSDYIVVDFDC